MERPIDKISLGNALDTPVWMMVYAAEPDRHIDVRMTYADLRIIYGLINEARNREDDNARNDE